jgi:hypothetical protein
MAYTTIDNPELYFQCKTYSGSSSDVTVTFDGSEDMQPDVVWLKKTSGSGDHLIYDSVRGTNKRLQPNATDAEVDRSSNNDELKSFNSDGWTLGTFNSNVTGSGSSNVSWNWKESATAGFDIITYSGTGSAKNESHSLSATPHWILTKCRSDAQSWATHHRSYSATEKVMYLDNTNAVASTDPDWLTAVSSSTISLGGSGSDANVSGRTYVAYLWTEKQGFSKFGGFTGNNSSDGTFVHCGFRPAWVMIKRTDSSTNTDWFIFDNKRNTGNPNDDYLEANDSAAETTSGRNVIDFLSNGFKCRQAYDDFNAAGSTQIYMAFAEAPFVNSNGVPCNAR